METLVQWMSVHELTAGGEGSGCHGENCGRPPGPGHAEDHSTGRAKFAMEHRTLRDLAKNNPMKHVKGNLYGIQKQVGLRTILKPPYHEMTPEHVEKLIENKVLERRGDDRLYVLPITSETYKKEGMHQALVNNGYEHQGDDKYKHRDGDTVSIKKGKGGDLEWVHTSSRSEEKTQGVSRKSLERHLEKVHD